MAASPLTHAVPQLTGVNFSSWKFRVRLFLEKEGVSSVLDIKQEEVIALREDKKTEFEKNDVRARCIIVQCVTDKHIEYLREANSAREMIQALESIFERKSCLSKMFVMKRLLKMKFQEGELQEHFVKVEKLIRELESLGTKLDDADKSCYLLLTMPDSYETIITALETLQSDKLTYDFVESRLLDAEMKMKESSQGKEQDKSAFSTNKKQGCFECGDIGHYVRDCPKMEKSQNQASRGGKSNRGRGRHGRGRGNHSNNEQAGSNAHHMQSSNSDSLSFVAAEKQHALLTGNTKNKVRFILDSGATDHLVSESMRKVMSNIEKLKNQVDICVANGDKMIAREKGLVKVTDINSGREVSIKVLVVPKLSFNLLSVRQLNSQGHSVIFTNENARIVNKEKNFSMQCEAAGRLYVAEFALPKVECNVADTSDTWHKRLGHLNVESLKKLNLPVSSEICNPCKLGKAKRLPFKGVELPRSNRIGELLHTDIAGPVNTPTKNGE